MLQHAPVGTPILYNVVTTVGMYYSRTTADTTLYQALHPSALPACNADQILASRWWWFLWLIVCAFKMVTSLCNVDGLWAIFFFTWKSTNPRLPTCVIANGTQDSHCDTAEVVIKISRHSHILINDHQFRKMIWSNSPVTSLLYIGAFWRTFSPILTQTT